MRHLLAAFAALAAVIMITGAGNGRSSRTDRSDVDRPVAPVVTRHMDDHTTLSNTQEPVVEKPGRTVSGRSAAGFKLRRVSINSGGIVGGTSGAMRAGVSAGQSVAGSGTSGNLALRAGFWHGKASGCPIAVTGDANSNGIVNATDAIYVVNYVFRAGPEPIPCAAAADVNCTGVVNATDIIYLVNYVFRGGPAPCDACSMIPGIYSCP